MPLPVLNTGCLNLKLSGSASAALGSTSGSAANGQFTLGDLPANCVITKVYYAVAVGGSGSNSPTLSIGYTSGTPTEIVNAQTPTLTAGTSAQPTLNSLTLPALLSTSSRTLYVKLGGTWSAATAAGSAFRGCVMVEFINLGDMS